MAKIQVHSDKVLGRAPVVTLSEPDDDGDYSWTCNYGHTADAYQPVADALQDAEIHVDIQCKEGR